VFGRSSTFEPGSILSIENTIIRSGIFYNLPVKGRFYLLRANSKLCFGLPETIPVTRNYLPRWGSSNLRSRLLLGQLMAGLNPAPDALL